PPAARGPAGAHGNVDLEPDRPPGAHGTRGSAADPATLTSDAPRGASPRCRPRRCSRRCDAALPRRKESPIVPSELEPVADRCTATAVAPTHGRGPGNRTELSPGAATRIRIEAEDSTNAAVRNRTTVFPRPRGERPPAAPVGPRFRRIRE